METYIANSDFKQYVDRYCTQRHKTVAEALKDKIVKGVEKYYKDKSSQVARIGNSVVPIMAQKLVAVNCPYLKVGERMPNMRIKEEQTGQFKFA